MTASICVGEITLYPSEQRLTGWGGEVLLTPKECKVLEMLMRHAGTTVTKSSLSRFALGRPHFPNDKAIDVHVASLKRKIGALATGRSIIKTVVGAGYQFQDLDHE